MAPHHGKWVRAVEERELDVSGALTILTQCVNLHPVNLPDALKDARLVHVGVLTRSGPHVTPEAFAADSGRLWLITGRRTVKLRVLKRDDRVAGLATQGAESVMFTGTATVVDPLTLRGVGSVTDVLRLPTGAFSYGSKNIRHVIGMAPDLQGRMATLPASRLLIEIKVQRTAVVREGSVVAQAGQWPSVDMLLVDDCIGGRLEPSRCEAPPDKGAAELTKAFLLRSGPLSVGWRTSMGPVVLPGKWDADAQMIRVPAAAMTLVGATSPVPACATFDRGRYRLSDKRGIMLRGMGTARRYDEEAIVRVAPERITHWSGDHTGTVVG